MVKQTFRVMTNNTLTGKRMISADVYENRRAVDDAIAKMSRKDKKYITYIAIYNDSRLPKVAAKI